MSAIDPSLLFYQQQQQQQELQRRDEGRSAGNGQASNAGASTSKEEDGSDGGMALDDSENKPNGDDSAHEQAEADNEELDVDESEPLDLKDDAVLAAFLAKMDDYEPILPNPVTRYYLERAGFQSADDRVSVLHISKLSLPPLISEYSLPLPIAQYQASRSSSPKICQRHCNRCVCLCSYSDDDRAR